MLRPSVIICIILAATSCRHQKPPGVDPFFGRTTVPPPPTGAASPQATDPYYRNPPAFPSPSSGGGTALPPPANSGATGGLSASGASTAVGSWSAPSGAGNQVRPGAGSSGSGIAQSVPSAGSSSRVAEPVGAIRTNDASAAVNRSPGFAGALSSGVARGYQQSPPTAAGSVLLWQSRPRVEGTLSPAPAARSGASGQPAALAAPAPARTQPSGTTASAAQPATVVNITDLPPVGGPSGSPSGQGGAGNRSSPAEDGLPQTRP
jgi:hypothetical protein